MQAESLHFQPVKKGSAGTPQWIRTPPATQDVRPTLLRQMNQRRILDAVQAAGELSRAQLVRRTGISAPTISKLVDALLLLHLLEEGDLRAATASGGRPARMLRLAGDANRVLGAVLDIRECSIVATGIDGKIRPGRLVRFATPDTYAQLIDRLVEAVRSLVGRTPAFALGVSIPGLIDRRSQQVLLSANLHQLDGHFPARDLRRRTGIPTILLHETDVLCLAERAAGHTRKIGEFALVDAAGGLGVSVISDGRLLSGHRGLAGEIGHITAEPHGQRCGCGNTGCLETVGCDSAFVAALSRRFHRPLDMDQAIQLIRNGTVDASQELSRTLDYLAIAVAAVVNVFNPAVVFVHARLLEIDTGLFQGLLKRVQRRALGPSLAVCRIALASGTKLQGAVAGTIDYLTSIVGPRL